MSTFIASMTLSQRRRYHQRTYIHSTSMKSIIIFVVDDGLSGLQARASGCSQPKSPCISLLSLNLIQRSTCWKVILPSAYLYRNSSNLGSFPTVNWSMSYFVHDAIGVVFNDRSIRHTCPFPRTVEPAHRASSLLPSLI